MRQLKLYDTTLRDGMGTPGISLSVKEKLEVVQILDRLGVDVIEAGFPSSNPKEVEFFEFLEEVELERATICAFGMTRRSNVLAENDQALTLLVESSAPMLTLVGKTWGLHLEKVTRVSREENLAMIFDSISFCRAQGKRVVYDAEHFFDGYLDDPAYALECLEAAVAAGAENVTLCDTNGSSLPKLVEAATRVAVDQLGPKASVGIHTHDDAGCAVANSLVAVEAGADVIQGTLNGYGERCGNANLSEILPSLQLKMGYEVVSPEQLASLSHQSHLLDEICNMTPNPSQAYVGWRAFMHKAGMHSAAVESDARTFEHVDPSLVGNRGSSAPSELSGRGTIRSQARRLGLELGDEDIARVLDELKVREHKGYHYEAAPASFELLLKRTVEVHEPLFDFESFRVITLMRAEGASEAEATIRLYLEGDRGVGWAHGNGPVNALDQALRSVLEPKYPQLDEVELVDYKVRIVEMGHGTNAIIRVLLECTDGDRDWSTIGVSTNVIEASWEALVDSFEYALTPVSEPVA
ncbi:MAG TPA: citramalate synthase [Solirubrobacterales bacterium]|nr:citramalate synthase [Solirubrobacterales bacterium]